MCQIKTPPTPVHQYSLNTEISDTSVCFWSFLGFIWYLGLYSLFAQGDLEGFAADYAIELRMEESLHPVLLGSLPTPHMAWQDAGGNSVRVHMEGGMLFPEMWVLASLLPVAKNPHIWHVVHPVSTQWKLRKTWIIQSWSSIRTSNTGIPYDSHDVRLSKLSCFRGRHPVLPCCISVFYRFAIRSEGQ